AFVNLLQRVLDGPQQLHETKRWIQFGDGHWKPLIIRNRSRPLLPGPRAGCILIGAQITGLVPEHALACIAPARQPSGIGPPGSGLSPAPARLRPETAPDP